MKVREARKILENDFKNRLLALGITSIKGIFDNTDKEIAKALKIKFNKGEKCIKY